MSKPLRIFRFKVSGIVDVLGGNDIEAHANLESLHIGDISHYEIEWSRELSPDEYAEYGEKESPAPEE